MNKYTIRKPHFTFQDSAGNVIGFAQRIGGATDSIMVNRLHQGDVVGRARAVGSCAYDLTSYGRGAVSGREFRSMQSAWRFMWGPDVPLNM